MSKENQKTEDDDSKAKEAKIEETDNVSVEVSSTVSKEVAIPTEMNQQDLAILDYSNFDTPARMLELGKVLVKSSLSPLKKPEDVVMALMTGKDLGIPFTTSICQIYPIGGRPTLGVHLQRVLLLQAGVFFTKTEDAVEIYRFVKAEEGKPILGTDNKPIYVFTGTIAEQPANTLKDLNIFDYRTTYEFEREQRMPSGTFKTLKVKSSYTLSEAKQAELTDKDVWIKFWKRMLDARAYTIGSKEIASDIINGLSSPSELSSNFYINDKGEEVPYIEVK